MPFVEGESLRERLDREKQLSVDDAVVIATEVADALEAAHEQEVIHRDIKPANILLSRGRPLVADFGIALPVSVAGGGRLTETGLSLGTPHYMSPEQATGDQAVGPSTDVYALGSVLYEMLVGQPPYTGSTAQAILGKILSSRLVSATEERPAVPAHVDSAIKKALEKLPADRFKSARDFVRALADPGFRHGGAAAATTEAAHPTRTVAALATVSAVMTVLAVWGWMGTTSAPASARLSRLTATLPPEHRLAAVSQRALPLAVSPDGATIAYVGESSFGTQLYVRELDNYESIALRGTERARQPFFSPSGEWIGYFTAGTLHRVRVTGGALIPVADFEGVPFGGAWGPDDVIVFAADSALWRVGAEGGEPDRIPLAAARIFWPSFLPPSAGGSQTPVVLVNVDSELHAVSVADGNATPLGVQAGGSGLYLSGYLVYTQATGIARAVRFDLSTLEVSGASISVLDNVFRPNQTSPTLAISATGTGVYVEGASERRLVLVDRDGRETRLPFEAGDYRSPKLSPDGGRLMIGIRGQPLHIFDLESGRAYPVPGTLAGIWSPSGDELVMVVDSLVSRVSVAPGSPAVPISEEKFGGNASHWGEDDILLLQTFNFQVKNGSDIFTMAADGSTPIRPVLDSEVNERWPVRSPDGRWIAYASDLTGAYEVYVRAFPEGEPRQVSVNGGNNPLFSRSGDELFWLRGEQAYAVRTEGLDEGAPLEPELLFTRNHVILGPSWDVRPNGDFLMMMAGPNFMREIQVVQNWVAELDAMFEESPR